MDISDTSWLFGVVVVIIWVGIWVGIELLLRDGDLLGAAVTGGVSGVVFAVVYVALKRAQQQ
jgi:uncharacterized MnhB-related membrane protein